MVTQEVEIAKERVPSIWQSEGQRGEEFLKALMAMPEGSNPSLEFQRALGEFLASDVRGELIFESGGWYWGGDVAESKNRLIKKIGLFETDWGAEMLWRFQGEGEDERACWKAMLFLEDGDFSSVLSGKLGKVLTSQPEGINNWRWYSLRAKAAYLLKKWGEDFPGEVNEAEFNQLAEKADYFCPEFLEREASRVAGNWLSEFDPRFYPLIYLFVLRNLREFIHSPEVTDRTIGGVIPEIKESFRRRIRRFDRQGGEEILDPLFPSQGLEIQGVSSQSVPLAGHATACESARSKFTKFNRDDYLTVTRYARLIESNDLFFEFSLPPTLSPQYQALVVSELGKLGFLPEKVPDGAINVQLNLGGVMTLRVGGVDEKRVYNPALSYMEPFILQVFLLATGYCISLKDLRNVTRGCNSTKGLLRPRLSGWDESAFKQVGEKEVEEMAELRMLWLRHMTGLYKTLLLAGQLGGLVIAHQQQKEEAQSELAGRWDRLVQEGEEIFQDFGIDLLAVWTPRTFRKLGQVLSRELTPDGLLKEKKSHFLTVRMRRLLGDYSRRLKPGKHGDKSE
jgi:hypothetical protein